MARTIYILRTARRRKPLPKCGCVGWRRREEDTIICLLHPSFCLLHRTNQLQVQTTVLLKVYQKRHPSDGTESSKTSSAKNVDVEALFDEQIQQIRVGPADAPTAEVRREHGEEEDEEENHRNSSKKNRSTETYLS